MKSSLFRCIAAGVVLAGSGLFAQAHAAVATPAPAVAVADGMIDTVARVCGPYGCRYVPGPAYRRPPPPVYGRPGYGPRPYYGRPGYARPRPYYGRPAYRY